MSGPGPLNPYVLQVGVKTGLTKKQKEDADRKKRELEAARQRLAEKEETNPYGVLLEENTDDEENTNDEPVAAGRDTVAPPNEHAVEESAEESDEEERQALAEAEALAKEVQEQAEQAALEEHAEESESIHDKIQKAGKHLSDDEKAIYLKLKHLSSLIAFFAKSQLYGHMKKYFVYKHTDVSLMKLAASPGVISENKGQPYTLSKAAKQFIRTFLHMHDEQLHCVIYAYLKLYYGIINEAEAFRALLFALERELKVEWRASEAWDVAMLHEVFLKHSALPGQPSHQDTSSELKQFTVLLSLHESLKDLHLKIIWIEWIANWKNVMKLFYPKKGPLAWTFNHRHGNLKVFTPTQIDRLLKSPTTGETFRSIPQLKQSYLEFCFGPHVKVINGKFEEQAIEPEKQGIYERLDKKEYFRKFEPIYSLDLENKLLRDQITKLSRQIEEQKARLVAKENLESAQHKGRVLVKQNLETIDEADSESADEAATPSDTVEATTPVIIPTVEKILGLEPNWNYYNVLGVEKKDFILQSELTQEQIHQLGKRRNFLLLKWHTDKANLYKVNDIPGIEPLQNSENFPILLTKIYNVITQLINKALDTLVDNTERSEHNKNISRYKQTKQIPDWQTGANLEIKEIFLTLGYVKEEKEEKDKEQYKEEDEADVQDKIKIEIKRLEYKQYVLEKTIKKHQRTISALKQSFRFNAILFKACEHVRYPTRHTSNTKSETSKLKTLIDNPIVTKYAMRSVKVIKPGILWAITNVNDQEDDLCCRNMDDRILFKIRQTRGWSGKNLVFVDIDNFFTTSSSTETNFHNCVLWTMTGNKKNNHEFSTSKFVNFGVNTKTVIFALIWKTRDQWISKFQELQKSIVEQTTPPDDYNQSFGIDGQTQSLIYSMCVWIEHVKNEFKEWWPYDNNKNFAEKNLHAKFNGRMAKIVYCLFKNEVIWNVFDTYLTAFMDQQIANSQTYKQYSRNETKYKRDVFDAKKFMHEKVDEFIQDFQQHAPKQSDNISNTILNYWISTLNIGPHPYNYAISNDEAKKSEYIEKLITNLHNVWEKEQNCYGGSTSTFTYAWKPARLCIIPSDKMGRKLRTTVAENNIMILAGHYGNEVLFKKIFEKASTSGIEKRKFVNISAELQTIVDTFISEIKIEQNDNVGYQEPSDIPLRSWEKNEQQVLSEIAGVTKKKFYNTQKQLRTWQDFFETYDQITTDEFQQFRNLLTITHSYLRDAWWNSHDTKNADLQYFIKIKDLWSSKSKSENEVQLTKAQEFLTHVYCNIINLTPDMIVALPLVDLPLDSSTRHILEQCYTAEFSTSNFSVLEDSLWTGSAEFLDVALKLTKQYAQELKSIEKEIVISKLQEEIDAAERKDVQRKTVPRKDVQRKKVQEQAEQAASGESADESEESEEEERPVSIEYKNELKALLQEIKSGSDVAMQNSICQKIIEVQQEPIVKKLKSTMEQKYSKYFSKSTDQRDALVLPSAGGAGGAGGGGGGGGGGGEGFDFEFVPSESSEEEDNHNNGGHRENFGADGREYHKHQRMDEDAKAQAKAKQPTFVDPFAESQNPNSRGNKNKANVPDADGFLSRRSEDMTNIYIVKPPVAPKAFISGRRVSALVPGAEDEVRLARGYGLDDAGS